MAKAVFERPSEQPGVEPFRAASDVGVDVGRIVFGRPTTTCHGVPGHWVDEGGEKPEFYPSAAYVAEMRGDNPPQK